MLLNYMPALQLEILTRVSNSPFVGMVGAAAFGLEQLVFE